MNNARNAYGIMQILILKHQLVKKIAKRYRMFINLRKLIHTAQLTVIFIKIWKLKFHGILSQFKTQCIDDTNGSIKYQTIGSMKFYGTDTSSSMEFLGTWNAPISMTRAVPWNSMEIVMRQFQWHEKFHGIPWNFECTNFHDTSSSMEFHGIPRKSECANFADTSSSVEFHGIPWNFKCANFADTSSSMEYIYIYACVCVCIIYFSVIWLITLQLKWAVHCLR